MYLFCQNVIQFNLTISVTADADGEKEGATTARTSGSAVVDNGMQLQLQRRTVALLAAAAAISKSTQPSRAVLAPYSLELPPGFVQLGNLGSRSRASGYLLVAGDFRDTIGAGSATTSACDAWVSSLPVCSDPDKL